MLPIFFEVEYIIDVIYLWLLMQFLWGLKKRKFQILHVIKI